MAGAYGAHSGGGWPTTAVVYLGAYLLLVLAAICLAAGLLYLAELAEEYSKVMRSVLKAGTAAVLALHLVLLLFDSHPLYCVASSFAAHLSYAALLPRFPVFNLKSPGFLLAVGLFLLSTGCWSYQFYYYTYASLEFVFGFLCVLVWFVPFCLGLAAGANEGALPSSHGVQFPLSGGGGMAKRTRSGGMYHLQEHMR